MLHERGAGYHYNGNHITIYKCIKLTCGTLQIHTVVYVKYVLIKIFFLFKGRFG